MHHVHLSSAMCWVATWHLPFVLLHSRAGNHHLQVIPALWDCWCLTVPAWTTTAIVHGLTGLLYMRPAAFFLPEMWYIDQITFHCLPWSQSSAFSCSISQREAWIIVWHGRCQHREMCFCLTTEPYTGFLIYFSESFQMKQIWQKLMKIWFHLQQGNRKMG